MIIHHTPLLDAHAASSERDRNFLIPSRALGADCSGLRAGELLGCPVYTST
jgi:hypothetical protein